MKKHFPLMMVVALWSILGAACSPASSPATSTPPPKPTQKASSPTSSPPTAAPTATSAPTATVAPFYTEDFANPQSGWEHYAMRDGVMDYQDGQYRMWIKTPNVLWVEAVKMENGQPTWIEVKDAILTVDAHFQKGPDDAVFGLRCQEYVFLITPTGKFGIAHMPMGIDSLQWVGEGLQPAEAIHRGTETNHLRAECVGNALRFSVNGQLLAEATAENRESGTVGLAAGALQHAGADVLFDNFQVYQP